MSTTVTIPIAGFKDVYEVPAVEKALQELPPSANEALRAIYEKMLRLGGQRFTVKPSALPEGASGFTTIELKANFLGTTREGAIVCRAAPIHLGRTTQVWDAVVSVEGSDARIAIFRCTQMVLWPK